MSRCDIEGTGTAVLRVASAGANWRFALVAQEPDDSDSDVEVGLPFKTSLSVHRERRS